LPKVFVIGSSGFVGRNLLGALTRIKVNNVFTVGRFGADFHVDLDTGHFTDFVEFVEKGDFVAVLAAMSSPDACNKDPEKARLINVTNTLLLIQALTKKQANIIFSSSDSVFSASTVVCFDETPTCSGIPYGDMKAEVEKAVSGLDNVKVVRFSYIVGYGDNYTSMLEKAAQAGEKIEVYDGFSRYVVALSDVLDGLLTLILNWDTHPSRVINFSGPNLVSRGELTQEFKHNVLPDLRFEIVEAPSNFWDSRPKCIQMTSDRFESLLGRPAVNISELFKVWRD
jgi:dTDP-4-dehydrorhamnose reductase